MMMIPLIPYLLPWDKFVSDRRLGGAASVDAMLLKAVLYDVLHQFCVHAFVDDHEFREEEAWMLADDHDWPFSFINLCASFGINHQSLREAMLRMRKKIQKEE